MNNQKDFYQFYLSQHKNKICRRLHFLGTSFSILSLLVILFFYEINFLFIPLLFGYLPAWVGHFFFEKNKPATFKYPFKSLFGDFRMFFEMLTGKIPW